MKKYSKKKPLNSHCKNKFNPLEKMTEKKRSYDNLEDDWKENLLSLTDNDKKTKILFYCSKGNKKMVKLLFESMQVPDINVSYSGDNGLTLASRTGDFATVKYLVKNGIDIDFIGSNGRSALHTYARKGLLTECKFLLDNLADPNNLGFKGQTPLFEAVINNKPEVIEMLYKYGANLNFANEEGIAPLMVACQNKYRQESLLTLLKLGANIETVDFMGQTPLYYAIRSNNRQFIDILIKRCNLNHQDNNGVTPLMLAAKYGQKETLRVFLSKGANIYLKDKNGKTALDYAEHYKHPGSVDILAKAHRVMEQGDQDLSFFGKQNRVANSCVK